MEIIQAIRIKLSTASKEEEAAWRNDFNTFCKELNPVVNKNARDPISSFSQTTVGLINLKAAVLIKTLKENLVSDLCDEDFNALEKFILSELKPEKYSQRFDVIVESAERVFQRYGIDFNHTHQGINLSQASYKVGVANVSRVACANVKADIAILRARSKPEATFRTLNKVLELKPNFFGIGFNINALIEKLFNSKS